MPMLASACAKLLDAVQHQYACCKEQNRKSILEILQCTVRPKAPGRGRQEGDRPSRLSNGS